MTLTTLQTMMTQMAQVDLDFGLTSNGETPLAADQTAVLNQALRYISRRLILLNHKVTLTVANGTQSYNLRDTTTPIVSQEVVLPFTVVISGSPLQDRWSRSYGLWSYHELQRQHPTFRTDTSGAPTLACWLGNNGASNLILYPTPNSAFTNCWIGGQVLAAPLVSGGDVPGIPDDCHEAIAALAMIYAALPSATEQEAWQRLSSFGKYHEPVEYNRQINKAVAMELLSGNKSLYNLFTEMDAQPQAAPAQAVQQ